MSGGGAVSGAKYAEYEHGLRLPRQPLTIVPVANGFIVRGEMSYQTQAPRDNPPEWRVFETFGALVEHLRTELVVTP